MRLRTTSRALAALAVATLFLLVLPSALALEASLVFSTEKPVGIAGEVVARLPQGMLHVEDMAGEGLMTMRGATGTLSVWSFRAASVGSLRPERFPVDPDAQERRFHVSNASMDIRIRDEPFFMTAAAWEGGAARAGGDAAIHGLPVPVRSPVTREDLPARPFRAPPMVPWRWDVGWPYVGTAFNAQEEGFPRWSAPTLGLEGPVLVGVEGGELTFRDAAGEHRYRLGWHREPVYPDGPGVDTVWRMVFNGTVASMDVPAQDMWGISAPTMEWEIVGNATWPDASGTVRTAEGETAFKRKTIEASGRFRAKIAEMPTARSRLQPVHYDSSGNFTALQIGEAPAAQSPLPSSMSLSAAALPAVSLLALLLALTETSRELASRALAALYTRFSREELLDHPQRRRLHDLVAASPGLHLREAHRQLGCAWGPFTFHLHMLVQGGYLRCDKHGRNRVLFLRGGEAGAVPLPHPLARRIHDAIPPDGSPIPFKALREQVGVSSQLLGYHLRGLAKKNLVTFPSPVGGRGKLVARAVEMGGQRPG